VHASQLQRAELQSTQLHPIPERPNSRLTDKSVDKVPALKSMEQFVKNCILINEMQKNMNFKIKTNLPLQFENLING